MHHSLHPASQAGSRLSGCKSGWVWLVPCCSVEPDDDSADCRGKILAVCPTNRVIIICQRHATREPTAHKVAELGIKMVPISKIRRNQARHNELFWIPGAPSNIYYFTKFLFDDILSHFNVVGIWWWSGVIDEASRKPSIRTMKSKIKVSPNVLTIFKYRKPNNTTKTNRLSATHNR